ncbi:MAG TPA: hypothetical protein VF258_03735 [Luteolibacter sp.]
MTWARKASGVAVLLGALIAAIWILQDAIPHSVSIEEAPPPIRSRLTQKDHLADEQAATTAAAHRRILDDWAELMRWLRSVPPPSAEEIRDRLLATRLAWTALDLHVRADAIKDLLETGEDASTGLDFKVGNHGQLASWPTLRVFLLDVLATSDPEMAAATANELLDKTTSPDEFATALRSLTRPGLGRADDRELLARFGQMLGHPEWQRSRGFAEAFDLARLIGTSDAARQLANWQGNHSLKSMAMDEFAAEHPEAMLEILDSNSTVDGLSRASLMARAKPENPRQLAAVDDYLRDPHRSQEEATAFLKTFPLRSATTGFRLYGRTPAPYDFEQIKSGDRAAKEQVDTWIADPALAKYQPDLIDLQRRLAKWIEQAK